MPRSLLAGSQPITVLDNRGRRKVLPRVLYPREAAAILRVSERIMRNYLRLGTIQGFQMGHHQHGNWRTTDLALLAFMGYPSPGFTKRTRPPRRISQSNLEGVRPNTTKAWRRSQELGEDR